MVTYEVLQEFLHSANTLTDIMKEQYTHKYEMFECSGADPDFREQSMIPVRYPMRDPHAIECARYKDGKCYVSGQKGVSLIGTCPFGKQE